MVRSMMSFTDLPISLWEFALETVIFTLNKAPSNAVEKTPYEMWTGNVSNKLSFLRIWGCEAYVKHLLSDKLSPKSDKCLFVGYPKETKGYYFYNQSEHKANIKCLLLVIVSFWKRSLFPERTSGEMYI